MKSMKNVICLALLGLFTFACESDSTDDGFTPSETNTNPTTPTGGTNTNDLPEAYKNFTNVEDIYISGDHVVIETKNVPDHGSPYFNANDSRYEAYNGTNSNFRLNPNRIAEQSITFKIPLNPEASSNPRATSLGPIGIAINGVVIFNQYAGPNQPLTNEINSFDQYAGHPQNTGQYHYHVEPTYLTSKNGKESLVGFLLDGFPVYGPIENGVRITNSDLDEYHGHISVTAEYPGGIYHYHITDNDPYINGNGFFGNPGSVSN